MERLYILMRLSADLCSSILKSLLTGQLMRMETAHQRQTCALERESLQSQETQQEKGKAVHNASSKISLVVRKMLLPLLDTPMHTHVVFDAETDQEELDLLEQMDRNRPQMLDDPKSFVQHLQSLIGRYHTYASGYSRVSVTEETSNRLDLKTVVSDGGTLSSAAVGTSVRPTGVASSSGHCVYTGDSPDHRIAPSLRQRNIIHSNSM